MNAVIKPKPRFGVYSDVSEADYHVDKTTFSSTLIKKMSCPAEAKHYMDSPPVYKEHFAIGRAIHSWILEPERFQAQFLTGISTGRRSGADKETWCDWFSLHGFSNSRDWVIEQKKPAATWNGEFERVTGKNIVTPDQIEEIKLMAKSVAANPNAKMLLDGGKAEQSIYATDPDTGLALKVRPDYMNDDFISDLKSIDSLEDYAIDRAIANFGYDISANMYRHVVQLATGKDKPFLFIFVQKSAPHFCRVIALSDESSAFGWDKYVERKAKLAECLESDTWEGYPDDLEHTLFNKK